MQLDAGRRVVQHVVHRPRVAIGRGVEKLGDEHLPAALRLHDELVGGLAISLAQPRDDIVAPACVSATRDDRGAHMHMPKEHQHMRNSDAHAHAHRENRAESWSL